MLTTKKLHTKSIVYELLWFLRDDSNLKYRPDNSVTIWNQVGRCREGNARTCLWASMALVAKSPSWAKPLTKCGVFYKAYNITPIAARHIVYRGPTRRCAKWRRPPCH
ncbi:MAG: hypothetical protein IPH02_16715 [Sphingobacteriales bacterium]|nr:hypothetical protein [Sphingobacteriales bacterium]